MNLNQLLQEATRSELISKSKNADKTKTYGTTRYDRRTKSRMSTNVAQYNKIDMDALFKRDILTVGIDVQGETDKYVVTVRFSGVLEEIRKAVKANNGKMEYKAIAQAMSRVFNSGDVSINCSCPDAKYRMRYWQNKNGYGTQYEPRPSDITNPGDTKGAGCKHSMLVISRLDWMMKVGSVINNYIKYCQTNLQKSYADYIFPKIYGMKYDKAIQLGLFDTGLLPSDQKTLSDITAQQQKQRNEKGQFIAGNEYRFTKEQPEDKGITPDENQQQFKMNATNTEFEKPGSVKQLTIDDYEDEGKKIVGNGEEVKDKRKYNRKDSFIGKKIVPVSKDQISMFDDEEEEDEEN